MQKVWKRMPQWLRDTVMFLFIMGCAVAVCELLSVCYDDNNPFATSVFILAVVLVSRFTTGYWPGILASAVGVVSVNYLFTYPFHEFNLTIDGYPLTFAVMLVVSVLVSTLTTQIKRQEQLRYEAERDRMRANLLRSVSHDIRTPLTAIMGLSATVEESETLTDEGRGMVEEIRQNAQWLLHLAENILSVTRFCDEGVVIEKSDEVVEEIVGSAIRRFRKNCDTDIPITVSKPEEILLAPMDATLIEQVLPVVLAVDVEQQRAQRAQLRRCDRDAADAAGRLALGRDLAADDELIVALDLVFVTPRPARPRVKRRANNRFFRARSHVGSKKRQTRLTSVLLPAPVSPVRMFRPGPSSRSARSMTATFSICSSRSKALHLLRCPQSSFSISWKNSSADVLSFMSRNAVSSPASVPTSVSMRILSSAEHAAEARPGSVLMTMMFCASAYDVTHSRKIFFRRSS